MHDWKKEFGPEYEVPEEITEKYADASWHNDAMPSFLVCEEDEHRYHIHLWVEHPDHAERSQLCGFKRFTLILGGECDGICLAESEELDEEFETKLRIAENYAKAHGLAHIAKHGGISKEKPVCSCGNRNMASMGIDIICDQCHKYCGEVH